MKEKGRDVTHASGTRGVRSIFSAYMFYSNDENEERMEKRGKKKNLINKKIMIKLGLNLIAK